jgi:hypothetical protein
VQGLTQGLYRPERPVGRRGREYHSGIAPFGDGSKELRPQDRCEQGRVASREIGRGAPEYGLGHN